VVATVMFLDVRGYTEQTARRAPQDTVDRLSSVHRWAKIEIERHHGAVDKFAGDAVMAVFNASGARLDHAVHALQAALAIRDKAAYAGMPVGIGLATGPAVVGQLVEGSNVSAVGESTNLAARLQSAAAGGEILLSEETYRRVRDWLSTHRLEATASDLQLKGFDRPISAFRLG
jgi:adenylate cyclase